MGLGFHPSSEPENGAATLSVSGTRRSMSTTTWTVRILENVVNPFLRRVHLHFAMYQGPSLSTVCSQMAVNLMPSLFAFGMEIHLN